MGYVVAKDLAELKTKARYVRVTQAGQKESSPHDVIEVKNRISLVVDLLIMKQFSEHNFIH